PRVWPIAALEVAMSFVDSKTASLVFDARAGQIVALRDGIHDHPLAADAQRWTVGSSPRCDVQIDDPYVSHVHCVIERRSDGMLVVRDHDSRNGTRINGNPIEVAELRLGSYLAIGRTTLMAVAGPGATPTRALEALRG